MNNPKISVIVPVYNAEQYLHRCVDSILAQTFPDFELLLIDDGSKDRSAEICDEYAWKDDRVRVFHKENGGVSSARNFGLDNAKGEWVSFVDADDIIYSNNLDILFEVGKNNPTINFVIGNYFYKMGNNKKSGSKLNSQVLYNPFELLYENKLTIRAGVILVKYNVISTFRFDEKITVNEDTKMWINLLSSSKTYFINSFIHEYVMDNSSLSNCKCNIKQEFGYQINLNSYDGYAKKFLEEIILRTIIRRILIKDYVGTFYILLKYIIYLPIFVLIYIEKKFLL